MRFFEGGLNHGDFDAPHNDAALRVNECEPCIEYARSILAIRNEQGLAAAERAHTDMKIASLESRITE